MNSCKEIASSKVSQDETLCESIILIEEYLNGKETGVLEIEKCCDILEKYTGIKSEYDGSPLALKSPSEDNLVDWKKRLKQDGIVCPLARPLRRNKK